jgi:hypothetical protein
MKYSNGESLQRGINWSIDKHTIKAQLFVSLFVYKLFAHFLYCSVSSIAIIVDLQSNLFMLYCYSFL